MAIGLIAGNLASHHTGVNKYLNDKFEDIGIFKKKEVKKEEEGFLSIFNFWGNEEEQWRLEKWEYLMIIISITYI